MPKELSLRGKKTFDRLFRIGKRKHSKNFYLVYSPSTEFKFACIVPKKVVKKASSRNYAKRVIRDIFRTDLLLEAKKNPMHLAVLCKSDLASLKKSDQIDFEAIKKELISLVSSI